MTLKQMLIIRRLAEFGIAACLGACLGFLLRLVCGW